MSSSHTSFQVFFTVYDKDTKEEFCKYLDENFGSEEDAISKVEELKERGYDGVDYEFIDFNSRDYN